MGSERHDHTEDLAEITRGLGLVLSGLRRLVSRSDVLHRLLQAGPSPSADEALVDELAKVLANPEEARIVVERAGFPVDRTPPFHTPSGYWNDVVTAARNGAIRGGMEALAEAAARRYPGNATFARYRSREA